MRSATLPRAHRWMTVREAAEYTRLSERAIRYRISDGTLPAYHPDRLRSLRLDIADVDRLITGGGPVRQRPVSES